MLTNLIFQSPLAALRFLHDFTVNSALCTSSFLLQFKSDCSRPRSSDALRLSLDEVSELTCEAAVHALTHEEEAEVAHQVVGEVQLRRYCLQRDTTLT